MLSLTFAWNLFVGALLTWIVTCGLHLGCT